MAGADNAQHMALRFHRLFGDVRASTRLEYRARRVATAGAPSVLRSWRKTMKLRRWPEGEFVIVALAVLLMILGCQSPSSLSRSDSGPTLTWSDEFAGAAGTPPNPSKWHHDTGVTGWGNNELEYYTSNSSNAQLDGNGHLIIIARREDSNRSCWYGTCRFTSARLTTYGKFSQAYGRFEARIKLPTGAGIWPAFWLLGDNIQDVGYPESGEIDIMENLGHEPSTVHGSLHGPGYDESNTYTLPGTRPLTDNFHVYAVDWSPTVVSFSVDGRTYEKRYRSDRNPGWAFDHPFYILLNVAVGGDWPGPPNETTQFPQRMVVDYVRVYAPPAAVPSQP
jgi:beta-glucanase (GH16 family)